MMSCSTDQLGRNNQTDISLGEKKSCYARVLKRTGQSVGKGPAAKKTKSGKLTNNVSFGEKRRNVSEHVPAVSAFQSHPQTRKKGMPPRQELLSC